MSQSALKKYKVKLEFRIRETITVEATNEEEAKQLALEQIEVTTNSGHYSTDISEAK